MGKKTKKNEKDVVNPELEREQKEKDIQEGKRENLVDKGMLPLPPSGRSGII